MKPVDFEYEQAKSIDQAATLLGQSANALVLAGGQTLGPMLNLRLAQPELLVDITRIDELVRVEESTNHVTIGACVSHAAIEDRRVADPGHDFLARVAGGIAYRAVRNRGTLGGSIANADPAADWVTCFSALGAEILISDPNGQRSVEINDFLVGAMETTLGPGELIDGIRIPRLGGSVRCGYAKISRKPGEFADAIAAIVHDPDHDRCRVVVGATEGLPLLLDNDTLGLESAGVLPTVLDPDRIRDHLAGHMPVPDVYRLNVQYAVLQRALDDAHAFSS
jgi:carbon-monoxide dehydrogenase medium subunit